MPMWMTRFVPLRARADRSRRHAVSSGCRRSDTTVKPTAPSGARQRHANQRGRGSSARHPGTTSTGIPAAARDATS